MEIKNHDGKHLSVSGKDNQGKFTIEINQKPDWFTDHKIQIRLNTSDGDNDDYVNMSIEELKTLSKMIDMVVKSN